MVCFNKGKTTWVICRAWVTYRRVCKFSLCSLKPLSLKFIAGSAACSRAVCCKRRTKRKRVKRGEFYTIGLEWKCFRFYCLRALLLLFVLAASSVQFAKSRSVPFAENFAKNWENRIYYVESSNIATANRKTIHLCVF